MCIDETIYLTAVNAILSNFAFDEARLLLYCLARTLYGHFSFTYEDFEDLYPCDSAMPQIAINHLVALGYMRKVHLLWVDDWYYIFFPFPRFDLPSVIECTDEYDQFMRLSTLHDEYRKKINITFYPVDRNNRK